MEYADDISKVTSNHSSMENFKHNTSEILKPRDLNVNHDKTEQYIISRTNNEWRLCKYLGSMLDTGKDIKQRKILTITAANQLKIIFDNKKLTPVTKMKAFRAYVQSIFLYNCEIWTTTPSQVAKIINTFQRRLLRTYVLNTKWPNIVKNEDIHRKTAATEWSNIIRKRRLKLFGKVIRADESTSVKKAFNYANAPYQRPRSKPTSTWLSIIKSDFGNLNLTWDEVIDTSIDIKTWETIVNDS